MLTSGRSITPSCYGLAVTALGMSATDYRARKDPAVSGETTTCRCDSRSIATSPWASAAGFSPPARLCQRALPCLLRQAAGVVPVQRPDADAFGIKPGDRMWLDPKDRVSI